MLDIHRGFVDLNVAVCLLQTRNCLPCFVLMLHQSFLKRVLATSATKMETSIALETVQKTSEKKSKWFIFNYMMMGFAVIAPTMLLSIWNYILFSNGWTYSTAAVSRVISIYRGDIFYVQLALVVPASIMLTMMAFVRNIQVHVYFVNDTEEFGLFWRYLNVLSTLGFIIGIIGVPLLIAFNSTDTPVIHIVFAGQVVVGFFFGEFFWGILTLKHRLFVYRNTSDCKSVMYFIDAIWYILVALVGVAGSTIYVCSCCLRTLA